jgi:aminomethyltransferase
MLKRTPLYDSHILLGARMVEFAGWEMPVQEALSLVQRITTNDAAKLQDNQVQYSTMTNDEAGVIDDLLVYRYNETYFLLIVNASGTDTDFAWIQQHAAGLDVEVHNTSDGYGLLALQGPRAEFILQRICDHMLDRIPYYWSQQVAVDGLDCRVSRTGYTGEDGFEILCHAADAVHIWNRLLVIGQDDGLTPCGLAARNTLRLEAAFRLYGNDMDQTTTPLEAGLGWVVKLNKGDFTGREVMRRQKAEGLRRKLVGFEVLDKAPARDGYPATINGQQVGTVASGSYAPFLKKNIGMLYLPIEHTDIGTEFSVIIRGREVLARVVETPFYKRERTFD